MRFKEQMRAGFAGCRLLHQGVDPHRGRPAKYFAIPGEFALIGYSDDTDTFMIPVSDFIPRQAMEALRAIQEGRSFTVAPMPTRRRSFPVEAPVVPQSNNTRRRTFNVEA